MFNQNIVDDANPAENNLLQKPFQIKNKIELKLRNEDGLEQQIGIFLEFAGKLERYSQKENIYYDQVSKGNQIYSFQLGDFVCILELDNQLVDVRQPNISMNCELEHELEGIILLESFIQTDQLRNIAPLQQYQLMMVMKFMFYVQEILQVQHQFPIISELKKYPSFSKIPYLDPKPFRTDERYFRTLFQKPQKFTQDNRYLNHFLQHLLLAYQKILTQIGLDFSVALETMKDPKKTIASESGTQIFCYPIDMEYLLTQCTHYLERGYLKEFPQSTSHFQFLRVECKDAEKLV